MGGEDVRKSHAADASVLANVPERGKEAPPKKKMFDLTSDDKYCFWRKPKFWASTVIFYILLYLVIAAIWGTAFYLVHKYYIPNPDEGGQPIFGYGKGLWPSYFQIQGSEPGISLRPRLSVDKITANAVYDISNAENQKKYEQDMNEFVQNDAPPGYEGSMGVAATVDVDQARERRVKRFRRSIQQRDLEGSLVSMEVLVPEDDFSQSLIIPDQETDEEPQKTPTPPRKPQISKATDRSEAYYTVVEGDILVPTGTHSQTSLDSQGDQLYVQEASIVHGSQYGGQETPIVHGSNGLEVLSMKQAGGASTCGGQGLGYDNRQPCFLIRPGRIFGWKPEAYTDFDEMEKSMPKRIPHEYFGVAKTSMKPNVVWVACYPYQGALRLEKLTYIGTKVGGSSVNGFPIEGYFPVEPRTTEQQKAALRNGQSKHPPMPYMYVKFHLRDEEKLKEMSNGTMPPSLNIQCFQLAKNIPLDLATHAGMSTFTIESAGVALFQSFERVARFVLIVLIFWHLN